MAVTYGSTGPAEVASAGISTGLLSNKELILNWMCQFCIKEKDVANEMEANGALEHLDGANYEETVSDNMEVSLVSGENLEYFEGDIVNNMQASAVSSDSLEHFEGANMEVSAVYSENLEYLEGQITNSSSSSVEDPLPQEMSPLGDVVTYEKISSSSQRGRHKLIESTGYSYTLKRKTKAGVHWQCVVRNKTMTCLATIKEVGNTFTRGHAEHCHPTETCSAIKK